MAVNKLNPTAANILSSLQIKGATTGTGPDKAGYVPILNSEGKLDVDVIPLEQISTDISIPGLNATAFVDLKSEAENPDGSIAKPFKTLQAAISAKDSEGKSFGYFILAPGDYGDVELDFQDHPDTTAYFIGNAQFDSLTARNYENGSLIVFINVSVRKLQMATPAYSGVTLLGYCQFGEIRGVMSSDDEITAEVYLQSVNIGPCATLLNPPVKAAEPTYVASDGRIGNDHSLSQVLGDTVADALKRLQGKRIRLPIFKTNSDQTLGYDLEDIQSEEDTTSSTDLYSFERFAVNLVEALNTTFYHRGSDMEVGKINGTSMSINGLVEAVSFRARDYIKSANYGFNGESMYLTLDEDGFLIVRD